LAEKRGSLEGVRERGFKSEILNQKPFATVSEISHTLSIIRLPAQLSDDINGRPPMTIYPEFVGSLQDRRLHGAYAVAVKGARRNIHHTRMGGIDSVLAYVEELRF